MKPIFLNRWKIRLIYPFLVLFLPLLLSLGSSLHMLRSLFNFIGLFSNILFVFSLLLNAWLGISSPIRVFLPLMSLMALMALRWVPSTTFPFIRCIFCKSIKFAFKFHSWHWMRFGLEKWMGQTVLSCWSFWRIKLKAHFDKI